MLYKNAVFRTAPIDVRDMHMYLTDITHVIFVLNLAHVVVRIDVALAFSLMDSFHIY